MIAGLLFLVTLGSLISLNFADPGTLHRGKPSEPWEKEVSPHWLIPAGVISKVLTPPMASGSLLSRPSCLRPWHFISQAIEV